MTTAVDTNVILDIIFNQEHFESSRRALTDAFTEGDIIVCEVVYGELAAQFRDHREVDTMLDRVGVDLRPSSPEALFRAGVAFADYSRSRKTLVCAKCGAKARATCDACGASIAYRQHLVADFMIGSHALVLAGRLLTRDRVYYRRYFPELVLV